MAIPRPSQRTITVSPSAWTDRIVVGRKGSDVVNRAPKGLRTSSINCCLLVYSFEATECPSIRQTMSGANTSVMALVPLCQASKVWRMIFRLASVRVAPVSVTWCLRSRYMWAGPRRTESAASLVAGGAGLEDGPSDLGAPGGLVGGVGGAGEVVLADGAVDGEGVPGDVGGE